MQKRRGRIVLKLFDNKESACCPSIDVILCRYWNVRNLWSDRTDFGLYWRLIYVEGPGLGVTIGDNKIEFIPDNFYLIPPQRHMTLWQNSSPKQFLMHFKTSDMHSFVTKDCYCCKMTGTFKAMLDAVITELRPLEIPFISPSGMMLAISMAAQALLQVPEGDFFDKQVDPDMKDIYTELEYAPEKDFHIADLEDKACRPALHARFYRQMGITPNDYHVLQRIAKGQFLLEFSNLAIINISKQVGLKNFHKAMACQVNRSPSEYRKQIREQ
jgi:hypothetical protein